MTEQSTNDKYAKAIATWGAEFMDKARETTAKPIGDLFSALMDIGMGLGLKMCTEALRDRDGFSAWARDNGVKDQLTGIYTIPLGEAHARYLEHRVGGAINDADA